MDEETRKKALQHYTVQASNASFDATNFTDFAIWPVYDGFNLDFRPTGEIVSYAAIATCKCGHPVWAEGSTAEIVYAIIEGKHFSHKLDADIHKGEI